MSSCFNKVACWRPVTLLENSYTQVFFRNSVHIFIISCDFEEWTEDYVFRNTFKWLILSYSFEELNNLLFQATIPLGMDTQLKMICVFSIVIDYYYRFFVNLSVSSSIDVVHKEYIDIFFVYDIIITAHHFWPVIIGARYTNE